MNAGIPRQVLWPRRKVVVTREQAFEKLAEANGIFDGGVAQWKAGAAYSALTAWGESYGGCVEFVVPPRGSCVSVKELNDALFWVTIEGVPGSHEVQLWLSAYNVPAVTSKTIEHRRRYS